MDKDQLVAEEKDYKTRQLIVFKLGSEEYGMFIDQIKEVVITPVITKVPQAPHYIKGVANIRGKVMAMVDLASKFEISHDVSEHLDGYTLVVEKDEVKMGLLVREVPNTLSVSEKLIENPDEVLRSSGNTDQYVQGIIKLSERLIILIDVFKAIQKETEKVVSAESKS